jgi:hypothetical protein
LLIFSDKKKGMMIAEIFGQRGSNMLGLVNKLGANFMAQQRLAGGLRINGQTPTEARLMALAAGQPEKSQKPEVAGATAKQSQVNQRFSLEMAARLEAANPKAPQAGAHLAESLNATAEKIKTQFGPDKANEFKGRILAATDSGIKESILAATIGGFFKSLAAEASAKPEISDKLASIIVFLNQGLENDLAAELGQNQPESMDAVDVQGLSVAMNQYFGHKDVDGQSDTAKMFDADFNWVASSNWFVLQDPNKVNPATVSVEEGVWQMVADHLRTTVGNEKAAAFFEDRIGNIFEAAATSVAVVARENGQQAAYDFVKYLNENVAPGLYSNGFSFQGWNLLQDYSQEGSPAAGPALTPKDGGLWFADPVMIDDLQAKKHQGLLTNWKYKDPQNGAVSIKVDTVDLDELYAQHQAGPMAVAKTLNHPSGNLVDTIA